MEDRYHIMQIIFNIPDHIAHQLSDNPDTLTRRSLELLVADAYRKGAIGAGEVGHLLGFSNRWDTYDFLQREHAEPPYTDADLESDRATLKNLLP